MVAWRCSSSHSFLNGFNTCSILTWGALYVECVCSLCAPVSPTSQRPAGGVIYSCQLTLNVGKQINHRVVRLMRENMLQLYREVREEWDWWDCSVGKQHGPNCLNDLLLRHNNSVTITVLKCTKNISMCLVKRISRPAILWHLIIGNIIILQKIVPFDK